MHALSLVQMDKYADRPVPYLSGGQQQRVALARALAVEPVVLLMDEPLSNLDARLREEVRHQILSVTKKVGVTVLYVTHDQSEALALGDRIAVMDEGQIEQIGSPDYIFSRPASPMVAEFLGKVNWLSGYVVSPGLVDTPIGRISVDTKSFTRGVRIGVRPSSIQVAAGNAKDENEFNAEIVDEVFLGEQRQLNVRLSQGTVFEVKVPKRTLETRPGNTIRCQFEAPEILVYGA
jgi:putative spermidine/putrescine transport system ATP-binding protein